MNAIRFTVKVARGFFSSLIAQCGNGNGNRMTPFVPSSFSVSVFVKMQFCWGHDCFWDIFGTV